MAFLRFLRGPQANAKQEDLDDLAAAGRGDTVPSVVGFKAIKKDLPLLCFFFSYCNMLIMLLSI